MAKRKVHGSINTPPLDGYGDSLEYDETKPITNSSPHSVKPGSTYGAVEPSGSSYVEPHKGESVQEVEQEVVIRNHLPFIRKAAYGFGHIFNDLCASMWFTYLLLFFHAVLQITNTYAGIILLIGQVADAAATPVIGFLCDRTRSRYGRRKTWHLAGTVMVAVSFFFFWHNCLFCTRPSHNMNATNQTSSWEEADNDGDSDDGGTPIYWKVLYFAVPIVIFQFGWASVQLSHLSLIPELTDHENERVGLNAIRYMFVMKWVLPEEVLHLWCAGSILRAGSLYMTSGPQCNSFSGFF